MSVLRFLSTITCDYCNTLFYVCYCFWYYLLGLIAYVSLTDILYSIIRCSFFSFQTYDFNAFLNSKTVFVSGARWSYIILVCGDINYMLISTWILSINTMLYTIHYKRCFLIVYLLPTSIFLSLDWNNASVLFLNNFLLKSTM